MNSDWRRDVLTVKEAAALLHVSTPTVYRMIRDEILTPAVNVLGTGKGVIVIPRSEVEHYIESLKTSARRLTSA